MTSVLDTIALRSGSAVSAEALAEHSMCDGQAELDLRTFESDLGHLAASRHVSVILYRGHRLPNSLYKAAASAFEEKVVAELAYLFGCYATICSICNVFDVSLTGTEEG